MKVASNKKDVSTIGKDKAMDFRMLFTVIILLCIGLIMVSSSSSYYALSEFNNSSHFLVRQLIFAVIGIIIMLVISKINYRIYAKWANIAYVLTLGLMLLVLVPGIGEEINGARRWINLEVTTFQPSELMKVVLAIVLSAYITKNYKKMTNIFGYVIPSLFLVIVCVVMYFQNHLSGTLIMIFITVLIFFSSGIKLNLKILIPSLIVIGGIFVAFIFAEDFRVQRITGFLNPEQDMKGTNWQPSQSLFAIGSGGMFGRGLGQSRQKYLWLPEAQNDFIFSVLAEEVGFVGSTVVICVFAYFISRGIRTALKCNDLFGMLLAIGITGMFAFQIMVNIAVVTSSIPVTGMPLPFFSYGGTSLVINLAAVGILLNISRQTAK